MVGIVLTLGGGDVSRGIESNLQAKAETAAITGAIIKSVCANHRGPE